MSSKNDQVSAKSWLWSDKRLDSLVVEMFSIFMFQMSNLFGNKTKIFIFIVIFNFRSVKPQKYEAKPSCVLFLDPFQTRFWMFFSGRLHVEPNEMVFWLSAWTWWEKMVDESTGQIDLSSFYLRQGARAERKHSSIFNNKKERDISDIRAINC